MFVKYGRHELEEERILIVKIGVIRTRRLTPYFHITISLLLIRVYLSSISLSVI